MALKKQIAPERIAEAKRLYELTLTPVPDIAAMMGISRKTLERRIHEWGWTPRQRLPRSICDRALSSRGRGADGGAGGNRRADIAAPGDPVSPQQRMALALRMQQVVEREMDAVERVLDAIRPDDEGEAERSARTLASVARTLREMAALK